MTKISEYSEIAVPTIDDLLIGTDVETQNQTKNFSIKSIIDLTLPYKIYSAILTQSGNSAPVATVLQNTLGGDITWTYVDPGVYSANSDALLTNGKTTVTCLNLWGNFLIQPYPFYEESNFPNFVKILNIDSSTGFQINGIDKVLIEIKVYN